MGSVHEAIDRLLKKRVAVKFLDPSLANNPQLTKRFVREAQAAAQIRHDNVCDVSDLGVTEDETPYLVMELLDGEPLDKVLRRQNKLPLERAVTITLQMLSALGAAHALGIVHRDLKPGNVILTHASDGREKVKLIDFGIAKFLDSTSSVAATATGTVVGSPVYMSPEQAAGKIKEIDHRADIWAVGVILYRILTGELPFPGDNIRAVFAKIFFDDPKPPREHDSSIPADIQAVILKALAKDKDERYNSTADLTGALIDALEPELAEALELADTDPEEHRSSFGSLMDRLEGTRTGELENSLSPTETTSKNTRRFRGLPIAVVVAVLLAIVVGAVFLSRPGVDSAERPVVQTTAPATPEAPEETLPTSEPVPVKMDLEPRQVTVELIGLPEGARVRYDGAEVQGTSIEGREGSEGVLQVEAEGYHPYTTQVVLSHGMHVDLAQELRIARRASSRRRAEPRRVVAPREVDESPREATEVAPPARVEAVTTPHGQPTKRRPVGRPHIVGDWED